MSWFRRKKQAPPQETSPREAKPCYDELEDLSLGPFQRHRPGLAENDRLGHMIYDGIHPHRLIWDDPMGRSFPRQWHIILFNMLVAALLSAWCFCRHPMPGTPTRALLTHLRLEARPSTSDFLWDYVVRLADLLPGGTVSFWTTVFAAVFGVLSVGLFTAILLRVGYLVRNECAVGALRREAMARRLSALSGGLYVAISAPFLIASTRTLPTTFNVFCMLGTVWLFSTFQHGGRRWRLAMVCLALGVCSASFATAWIFAPIMLVLLVREIIRWRLARSWRTWLTYAFCLLLGLSIYLPEAIVLFRRGSWLGLYSVWTDALLGIFTAQLSTLTSMQFSPVLLVFACIILIPYCSLFLLSRRCPWFYEWPQTAIRIFFAGGILATLYNVMFSPHFLVPGGMDDPVLVPTLLLGLCFGYVVGDLWCLGQLSPSLNNYTRPNKLRRIFSVLALLLPLATFSAIPFTVPAVRIPEDIWAFDIADRVLDARGGRNAFIVDAPLDDSLLLAAYERREDIIVLSASRMYDSIYQKVFARHFPEDSDIARNLGHGHLEGAIRYWLDDPTMLAATIANTRPDLLYEYAYLLPAGLAYSTHIARSDVSPERLPAVMAAQRPLWDEIAAVAQSEVPLLSKENPFFAYLRYYNAQAAVVVNNSGVLCADAGLFPLADDLFQLARRIAPDNQSARMNAFRTAAIVRPDDPEVAADRADWERDVWAIGGGRWVMGIRYGYLYDAEQWMRDGYVWALSGSPLCPPAARRRPALDLAVDGTFAHFIDQAFVAVADPLSQVTACRNLLLANPWNSRAILELCRLAICDKRPDIADAYVDEAIAFAGVSEKDVQFERAMADYVRIILALEKTGSGTAAATFGVRGAPGVAFADIASSASLRNPDLWTDPAGNIRLPADVFREISRTAVHDMRVWMTLYLFANGERPVSDEIERTLKNSRPNDVDVWTTLASIHVDRDDLVKARSELNHALSLSVDRVALWETALTIAERTGNQRFFEAARQRLLAIAPYHYVVFQQLGQEAYDRGDLDEAIRVFQRGIFLEREPVLLNNLAHVLAEKSPENYDDALLLLDEAIRRNPAQPRFLNTRSMVHLRNGHPSEALADMKQRFKLGRLGWSDYIHLADVYRVLGQPDYVAKTLRTARLTLNTPPDKTQQPRVLSLETYVINATSK